MFALEGAPPQGLSLVQLVAKTWRIRAQCAGPFLAQAATAIECFRTPGYDLQSDFFPAEAFRFGVHRGWLAWVALRVAPPPIPDGHNAVELGPGYLASIGTQATSALMTGIMDGAVVEWVIDYEYDGCHSPEQADTTCGSSHCLRLWVRRRASADESFGAWEVTPWGEAGGAW